MFNNFDMLISVSNGGCAVFVHHLEIVAWSRLSFPASHLLVHFFSASTTFNLFKSSFFFIVKFIFAKIHNYFELYYKNQQIISNLENVYNFLPIQIKTLFLSYQNVLL